MRRRRKKIQTFVAVRKLGRMNYAVVFSDELGQVAAFDTHGPLLLTTLAAHELREARLLDILARKAA